MKRIAAEENTTINQFTNVAVAEKAAALCTEAYFRIIPEAQPPWDPVGKLTAAGAGSIPVAS